MCEAPGIALGDLKSVVAKSRGALEDQAWRAWGYAAAVVPGSALAGVIALAATFISTIHAGPQLLYALFFGVAFHYLSDEARTRPGIEFCSRAVLRFGVALLGARISAA